MMVVSSVCALNEEEVPRLPIFPAQWAIDDPRQRSYLVVWGNGAYALKMAVSEGGNAVVVTLSDGESRRIPILRRPLPKGSALPSSMSARGVGSRPGSYTSRP